MPSLALVVTNDKEIVIGRYFCAQVSLGADMYVLSPNWIFCKLCSELCRKRKMRILEVTKNQLQKSNNNNKQTTKSWHFMDCIFVLCTLDISWNHRTNLLSQDGRLLQLNRRQGHLHMIRKRLGCFSQNCRFQLSLGNTLSKATKKGTPNENTHTHTYVEIIRQSTKQSKLFPQKPKIMGWWMSCGELVGPERVKVAGHQSSLGSQPLQLP